MITAWLSRFNWLYVKHDVLHLLGRSVIGTSLRFKADVSTFKSMVHCTYMIMAVQSLCTLPVNRKFISENDRQLRAPHLPAYLPRLSPAMYSGTDLDKDGSIIIIMTFPQHYMVITY